MYEELVSIDTYHRQIRCLGAGLLSDAHGTSLFLHINEQVIFLFDPDVAERLANAILRGVKLLRSGTNIASDGDQQITFDLDKDRDDRDKFLADVEGCSEEETLEKWNQLCATPTRPTKIRVPC